MPKVPIRKVKRVSVLTKRAQCLGKHYKERSYRPMYEKLKNNNSYLAKALSKEKQSSQALFSQNVQLIGEIQQLNRVCNTRDTVISNVLNNAKEILKMLVTMTGYMTNTISMCQELVASNTAVRLSSASAGRKESSNRLSTKSPAKGVVKPMVGGHTITKPTINLSRVNMESINNISRLSDIQEVTTPTRSPEMNETRSPIISLPSTPLRYENNRTCRLPERLTISSPRVNAADEQRLRRKRRSHHSKRLSVSFSRSRNRWSDEAASNTGQIDVIDTSIDIESQESNDGTSHELSDIINVVSESQISANDENETHTDASKKDPNVQINNKVSNKDFSRNVNVTENSRLSQNNTRAWEEEDPLEGPSWLFNNTLPTRDNEPEELESVNDSDVNNNTSQVVYDDSSVTESNEEASNLNESTSDTSPSEKDAPPVADRSESDSSYHEADGSIGELLPAATLSNRERSLDNEDSNVNDAMKFASFVTLRRGSEALEESVEDFTLMLRQPAQNMQFNIDNLRLPVLEESNVNNSTVNNESDTDVNATIPRVTNIPVASVSNRSINEFDYNHITIKLPLILINDHKRMSTPQKTKHSSKSVKKSNMKEQADSAENSSRTKGIIKSRNTRENSRDPSMAKVVLEKLNESHVKSRRSSNDIQTSTNNLMKDTSDDDDNRDSENGVYASSRPRRKKAPVNLKEPKLNKKLRRE
ncbi:dentin sialophosphoprotein [Monomorium pharaonis]|uniref:dentin sialophosphoprotein n=1 Tax=Monomorium pharaonis TaxID=307658 RepID=UPI00063EFB05|nr:dentin sialophosphoprotein [Monomorium pharaonis]XP_028050988.1 dentin sialophosphoprotein [Monomorium pharaonis]